MSIFTLDIEKQTIIFEPFPVFPVFRHNFFHISPEPLGMVLDFDMSKFVNNNIINFRIRGHDKPETEKNIVIGSTRSIAGLGTADSDLFGIKF